MLQFTEFQVQKLAQPRVSEFEAGLKQHLRDFSPAQIAALSDRLLDEFVRTGTMRAKAYGFTSRGSIRLFLELILLFGVGFDDDPQYTGIAEILGDCRKRQPRAQRLPPA